MTRKVIYVLKGQVKTATFYNGKICDDFIEKLLTYPDVTKIEMVMVKFNYTTLIKDSGQHYQKAS